MKRLIIFMLLLFFASVVKVEAISSEAVILMDEDSDRVLYEHNADKKKLIASITKIMTAVLAIESEKLDDIVTIDETILKAYGSNIYIEIGEEMPLRDLVYGLMLRSGNDAAIAISNYVSGSEDKFVELMNKKAKEIGMKHTVFKNPHGLDEDGGNVSTARDMALLAKYASNLEEYKTISGTKKHVAKTNYKTYVWDNKNKMLKLYNYSTGGKTGFTDKAKRTLVSTATKKDMNLIVVTLNDPDDWNTHKNLFEYGFNNYRKYRILNKLTLDVGSEYYKEHLYILDDYYFPLMESETGDITIKVKLLKLKHYKNEDKVGEAEIYFKDKLVHTENIYVEVLAKKPRRNFWQRILGWLFYDK